MNLFQDVELCETQCKASYSLLIDKALRFQCSQWEVFCHLKRFRTCTCELDTDLQSYFCKRIMNGAKEAAFRTQSWKMVKLDSDRGWTVSTFNQCLSQLLLFALLMCSTLDESDDQLFGSEQVWRSGRGAIAECHCSVL